MTSERKISANRINGRKSRGPRTAAGKSKASRNAWRHGLATISYLNPAASGKIAVMAKVICGEHADPLLFEQALIIAENTMLLHCVGTERVALIERLRDIMAKPLAKRDTLTQARARQQQTRRAHAELTRMRAELGMTKNQAFPKPEQVDRLAQLPWKRMPVQERDEFDAMREAMPDLERLVRYERRACSRRKRAMREFMAIKSRAVDEERDASN
jgi:hypothetical protein